MSQVVRRGDKAILTVVHPVLGTDLEVGATSIRLGPEQYLVLVDAVCNACFLAPHLVGLFGDLAAELKLPEVTQFLGWLREADRSKEKSAA